MEPVHAPLETVIQRCVEEAKRREKSLKGFCYELFRRGFDERNGEAFRAVTVQYRRFVLKRLGAGQARAEEMADDTFARFWVTLHARPIAERFPHVGSLLKFLSLCARSVLLDTLRQDKRASRLSEVESLPLPDWVDRLHEAEQQIDHDKRWQPVVAWYALLTDEREKRVFELSYLRGLSPLQICAQFPDEFPEVAVINAIKDRLFKRLRRALGGG